MVAALARGNTAFFFCRNILLSRNEDPTKGSIAGFAAMDWGACTRIILASGTPFEPC